MVQSVNKIPNSLYMFLLKTESTLHLLSSICLAKCTDPVQMHHPNLTIKSFLEATGGYIDANHVDFDVAAQNCEIYK